MLLRSSQLAVIPGVKVSCSTKTCLAVETVRCILHRCACQEHFGRTTLFFQSFDQLATQTYPLTCIGDTHSSDLHNAVLTIVPSDYAHDLVLACIVIIALLLHSHEKASLAIVVHGGNHTEIIVNAPLNIHAKFRLDKIIQTCRWNQSGGGNDWERQQHATGTTTASIASRSMGKGSNQSGGSYQR